MKKVKEVRLIKKTLTKRPSLISEMTRWANGVCRLHDNRTALDLNLLFDIHPVKSLITTMRIFKEHEKSKEDIEKEFVSTFERFCKRVYHAVEFESKSGRISEKLSSVSQTSYFIDWGFEIYSQIIGKYSEKDLQEKLAVSYDIQQALSVVAQKRLSMIKIIDPLYTIRNEQESRLMEKEPLPSK